MQPKQAFAKSGESHRGIEVPVGCFFGELKVVEVIEDQMICSEILQIRRVGFSAGQRLAAQPRAAVAVMRRSLMHPPLVGCSGC